MVMLCIENCSLPFGHMDMVFMMFAELWVTFFQARAELWVQLLNQNGTSPLEVAHNRCSSQRCLMSFFSLYVNL